MSTMRPSRISRLTAALSIAASLQLSCRPAAEAPEARAERAYSVQLHVHGSFSEGVGSIDSHSFEAGELGLDVIWWSDHDFRIASYRPVTSFGFEDWSEPSDRGESWTPWTGVESVLRKRLIEQSDRGLQDDAAEIAEGAAYEGGRSLRLSASNYAGDFRAKAFRLEDARDRQKRPLAAGVTLRIAIRPERSGADGRPFVRIGLSEHAPREGLGLERYALHYYLDNETREAVRVGSTFRIPLPYREDEWNRYELPLSDDAVRGFPFLHGDDNSLNVLALGVEVRGGATSTARFDALHIDQELVGEETFARQRELLGAIGRETPGLHQLQGVEISYLFPHLNEFSVGTRLLDYDALVAESGLLRGDPPTLEVRDLRGFLLRRAVEAAHARGGLVSYNHMLGAAQAGEANPNRQTRQEVYEQLLGNGAFGADLLEVGYRDRGGHDLDDHLWVWDQLARAGLFLVGVGVSDSHGGPPQRWRDSANNFVSWIYAASPDPADLIEGLRGGRVFFGDLASFDGEMDLTASGGARMGEVVPSDREEQELSIRITGLSPGDRVRLMASGRPAADWVARSADFEQRQRLPLDPSATTPVRVEVYDARGMAKVFSNPIVFRSIARSPEPEGSRP